MLTQKIKNWTIEIEEYLNTLKDETSIDLKKSQLLEDKIHAIFPLLQKIDEQYNAPDLTKDLKSIQSKFWEHTSFFNESYFFNRGRVWPQGYPGDYITLESIYKGMPVIEKGIGMYLDKYFLTRALARGVRERKIFLAEYIKKELASRESEQSILNIACGSSREIFDIGASINQYKPEMTFLDYDEDAVNYSRLLLHNANVDISNFSFIKFNALKLASLEFAQSKFEKKDVIYSAGLFDYIKTDTLIKMINSLFNLLNDGGVLIAPFKDKENYQIQDYHWLVNWSFFFQRTIDDVRALLEEATGTTVEIIKSGSPAINFFIIRK